MQPHLKRTARKASDDPLLQGLARAGFAASGVIHIGVGVLAIVIASGGRGEADQSGALKAIASVPAGFVVLWIIAVGLFALGVWYIVEGLLPSGSDASRWKHRLSAWGKAAGYIAVGLITVVVAVGGRPNSERAAQNAGSGLLRVPGGPVILGVVGVGITLIGLYFGWRGVTRGFRDDLATPDGPAGTGVIVIGVVGYVAKGVALVALGVLLAVAAIKVDPSATGGIDRALVALVALPYGPVLVDGIGGGLILYGLYMFVRTFRARM
ncbi:MAG TPA: DUF1206 domain-containing protein [Microbacterium sp.]|nr:DUF1206 domain-containing protein [Microbacterium sp.]